MARHLSGCVFKGMLVICLAVGYKATAQPFTIQGPGVDTNDFRVTTFASGLDFPLGMAELADGSLLVTISEGSSFFDSTGKLVRFADTNFDGVADGAGTILYSNLPGTLTDLKVAGDLVVVIGRPFPITILRVGESPEDPLTWVGEIIINYGPEYRPHACSALAARKSSGYSNRYDLLFQLGAAMNFATTTTTLNLTNNNIPGAEGVLSGDAIHMLTLVDHGTGVTATNLIQIASGARNAAGLTFHPATGDLYFQDNGIDGLVDRGEPLSADELNVIARTNIGGGVEFFGFPANYTEYRTGTVVGGAGTQPLIAFQPVPDPFTGLESEGANDISFAPPGFPAGLNTGVLLGFHGKFSSGGFDNEENPLVYADPATGNYFHFIAGQQPGIGHLDGLLATSDSLFVADLVTTGDPGAGTGAGAIYQIKSLAPLPPSLQMKRVGAQLQVSWDRGQLQEASEVDGPWTEVEGAYSPHLVAPIHSRQFYRTCY